MAGKVSTKELGLILGAKLVKTEDLHYGLWEPDLEVTLANLPTAQARYSDFLISHIPEGTRTILDVGCGTGHLAQLLTARGFQVEAVSPSPELTRLARERLGDSVAIYPTTFEAFQAPRGYDLVLFSESFQYIPFTASLPKARDLLEPGGHVIISDFFRRPGTGVSALKGGHDIEKFHAFLATQPLEVLSEKDITEQTAPNLQLMDAMLMDYVKPIWETLSYWMRRNHPWAASIGGWLFRKRLNKLHFKYLSRERSASNFAKHKTYRTLLLRKKAS